MRPIDKSAVLNRLKTARGHLRAVLRMVEEDRYCVDVMKQLSAVQSSLERVNRILLRGHLETCVADAIAAGQADEVIEELIETLKYTGAVTGPAKEEAP